MGWSFKNILDSVLGGQLGYGKRVEELQRQALAAQKAAQDAALSSQISEKRRAAQALRAANQKRPNPTALLGDEQRSEQSTLLTGPRGVARERLRLGKPTLLGDAGSPLL